MSGIVKELPGDATHESYLATQSPLSLPLTPAEITSDFRLPPSDVITLSPDNGPIEIAHNNAEKLNDRRARKFLLDHGAPEDDVNRLFKADGTWHYFGQPIDDLYDLPLFALKQALKDRFAPPYAVVDYSLNGSLPPYGFNSHNIENHIEPVGDETVRLIQLVSNDVLLQRLGLMAAYGHDSMNWRRRSGHSMEADEMYRVAVPNAKERPGLYEVVSRAMRLHDEPVYFQFINDMGDISPQARRERVSSLGAVTLALGLADKSGARSIWRQRVSRWAREPEALNDKHKFLNFCGESLPLRLSSDRRTMVMTVRFNPYLTEDEAKRQYPGLGRKRSHHDGWKVNMPAYIHEPYKLYDIPYMDGYESVLHDVYGTRNLMAAQFAHALIPELEEFNVEIIDVDPLTNKVRGGSYRPYFADEVFDTRSDKFLELAPKAVRRRLKKQEPPTTIRQGY